MSNTLWDDMRQQNRDRAIYEQAAHYAYDYMATVDTRSVFPTPDALARLAEFGERAAHAHTREALSEARSELGQLQGKLAILEPEREQYQALQKDIAATQQSLGELTGKLAVIEREREAAEQQRAQDRQLQTRLLIAVGAVALLLLAVVILLALTGA